LNTEQLSTFLSLVETKSFSLAAGNLFVAQSTVSKRISDLEAELGARLFTRDRSGAQLTAAGKALLEYAEQIVNMEEKAKEQIHRRNQYAGYLVIGTVFACYEAYLNEIVRVFLEKHPDISLRVNFGHSSRVIADVKRAALDVAFSHHPYDHPEYVCQLVEEDNAVLVTDAKNTVHIKGISHDKIKELPFISSNFLYATTHSWLFPQSQQFRLEMEIAKYTIPFLEGSGWYTLLARKLVEKELASGKLVEIPILDTQIPTVRYYVIYRKEGVHQMALRLWLDYLRQHMPLASGG